MILCWYGVAVRSIVSFAERVPGVNLSERLSLRSRNEVGELALCINRMLDRIETLVKQTVADRTHIYELELTKKRVELSALQSQINPHFLYNTLDSIKGFGFLYNSPEIVEIATSIAHIMRYVIKSDEFVPVRVREEIVCMQKYLRIIAIRFDERFRVEMRIDPSLYGELMPRFILQPILENAVYHGLEPRLEGGLLSIRGYWRDADAMQFEVYDNGKGIERERLAELNEALTHCGAFDARNTYQNRGIGLLNIHNRLRTMYGSQYGVVIESGEGSGTTIKLIVARREK